MKYKVTIHRTYATELEVEGNDVDDIKEWLYCYNLSDKVLRMERDQNNITETRSDIELMGPSDNEAEEMLDLVGHIRQRIYDYRHVKAYIPKEMWDALDKMSSHLTVTED
jgi:hypothetical protein